jgi:serine/threonine protein kinase/tetratricopeptide (TPR) repeat protein
MQAVFAAAFELSDPAQRAALLDRECAGDDALRRRVEVLLAAHDDSAGLPAADPVHTGPHVAPTTPAAMQPGTVIAGRYKLLKEIGEGGMGTVWVAEQTQPVKRKVALKLIKAGMDSRAVLARFEAERQALALMDHPNIAKVLDGGLTDEQRPFFVMEYVKGIPITQYCDAMRMNVAERLHLFAQVCSALQHAHQKGIIHRDLKPSNILVAPYDDRPVPKVIDFGLAKAMHQPLTDKTLHTAHETVLGTPLYMSPEQAQLNNLDVDTRSDIYSLGVLLYELLTGTTPLEKKRFKQAAWDEIRRVIREEEPPRPSARLSSTDTLPSLAACRQTEPAKLTRQVRGELDWIVMKALEKDRGRRYETANGFAQDVQRYLAGEAVLAAPPSPTYRLRKLLRRHRGAVSAVSAVLLALLVGFVCTTLGLMEARRAAEAEQRARHVADEEKSKAVEAAKAERQAKEKAQRRLAQIEKGMELFAGLVRGLNPRSEEQGQPPLYEQLRQRAVKAADALVGEAVGDPEAVARLQTLLACTLVELGEAGKAVELAERARATRQAWLGSDHPDTLNTLNELAVAYEAAGKFAEATALLEQVREAVVKKLGADHPDTLATQNNLALAYRTAGKPRLAIALLEQVRDVVVKKHGADHLNTLLTLNNLALAYQDAGKLSEAIALQQQVRDSRVKKQGADHPDTLTALNNVATAYYAAGRLPEAIALFEQVREAVVKKLGADHPDTLATQNNLALAYRTAGKPRFAIALLEQVRDASMKRLGASHPCTLTTLDNLAAAYLAADKRHAAIGLFEQVRDARMIKLGADHPDTLTTLNNLATAYYTAGKLAKAIGLFEQVRDARMIKLGADHPDTLAALGALAKAHQAAGNLDRALPLFAQAASGIEKHRFQHQHSVLIIHNTIAAYEQAKRFDQAETWRRKWLAVVKQHTGANSAAYAGELVALGLNLLQQEKWTDAAATLKESLAIRQKTQPDDWSTFNALSLLGGALLGQKKYAAAEPLLVKGFEGMKQRAEKIPPAGRPRLGEAVDRLIALCEVQGKPDEAAKWRKQRQALRQFVAPKGAEKK